MNDQSTLVSQKFGEAKQLPSPIKQVLGHNIRVKFIDRPGAVGAITRLGNQKEYIRTSLLCLFSIHSLESHSHIPSPTAVPIISLLIQ